MNEREEDPDGTLPIYQIQYKGLKAVVCFPGEFLSEAEKETVLLLIKGKKKREAAKILGIRPEEYNVRLSRIRSRIENQGFIRPLTVAQVLTSLQSLKALSLAYPVPTP